MESNTAVFTTCNGRIGNTGYCDKCMQRAQTTSSYCGRLIEVPVSPSEDKTAEPELRAKIKETLERVYLRKFPTTKEEKDLEYATDILIPVVEEYATLCRNKAIEEAVKVATENGTVRIDLVSTLNKLKV